MALDDEIAGHYGRSSLEADILAGARASGASLDSLTEQDIAAGDEFHRESAVELFRNLRDRIAAEGPPPLGVHVLMGPDAPVKIANLLSARERGALAPTELIGRRS